MNATQIGYIVNRPHLPLKTLAQRFMVLERDIRKIRVAAMLGFLKRTKSWRDHSDQDLATRFGITRDTVSVKRKSKGFHRPRGHPFPRKISASALGTKKEVEDLLINKGWTARDLQRERAPEVTLTRCQQCIVALGIRNLWRRRGRRWRKNYERRLKAMQRRLAA